MKKWAYRGSYCVTIILRGVWGATKSEIECSGQQWKCTGISSKITWTSSSVTSAAQVQPAWKTFTAMYSMLNLNIHRNGITGHNPVPAFIRLKRLNCGTIPSLVSVGAGIEFTLARNWTQHFLSEFLPSPSKDAADSEKFHRSYHEEELVKYHQHHHQHTKHDFERIQSLNQTNTSLRQC